MRIALVTDSTSDIPREHVQQMGVFVVPLYVHFKGSVYKDWVEITPAEIFEAVQAGAEPPTTSQPSPQDFKEVYQKALEQADHVLSIHISSKLSGTVQSAQLAASEFPGKVTVFDSQAASAGIGMLVSRAHEMLQAGRELPEILAELERIRADHRVRFTVATLEFLRRNGRIGGAQALLGTLLNIKPILEVRDGRVDAAGRARGEKKALAEMVRSFREWAQGREKIRVYFMYTADARAVENLRDAILSSGLPVEEVYTSEIGAVIASHAGPGTYGYYAYSL
ncbi:DegV family protein [Marinithermus hydrothermalis]|uniref:DegV family protein n=1 Tax=Marinithermus hydrothermalis (strain DSM 14884 / JCM 11576 / T1) TaxID=869210 RepID=F2NPA6_MARHT|nr:DegV family protein [Marinithermus hydrothermalis]AEB11907.1 degV family protein [Marinithermus hydrothermalis DSM 14884]